MRIRINKEAVEKVKECVVPVVKVLGKIVAYAAAGYVANEAIKTRDDGWFGETGTNTVIFESDDENRCRYSDAVKAIVGSSTSSYYKDVIVSSLKHNMPSDYYRSVISIVQSEMSSYYKAESIKKLR